jgi:hypothetical protein
VTQEERCRRLARILLARACADLRDGVPLAARLEDAALAVLGHELREDGDDAEPDPVCQEAR